MDLQIREGNLIKVSQKATEGKGKRLTSFVGKVMKVKGTGINQMITVRNTFDKIDVDRIFPIASPTIESIQIVEEKPKVSKKKTKKSKK